MGHILNKLTGAPLEAVKEQLAKDAAYHAEQGMYLEHVWTNVDKPEEVFFLFRVDDLNQCKETIEKVYAEAREKNPGATLPEKIYLEEV